MSGQEYWTLTNKNTNINYIISHNNEKYKNIIDASGLRVTEQILEKTRVSGTGTYNDPWIFSPKYNLTIKNLTPSYGMANAESDYVYAGEIAKITLNSRPGYEYETDTCSDMKGYLKVGNNIRIKDITKDIVCSFTFKPKEFIVKYDSNGGTLCSPDSYTYKKEDTYNINCNPTRTGFTFDGWYTELDGGIKLNSTTKITNYNNHSIYAHWISKPITLANQSFVVYRNSSETSVAIRNAEGGSGLYTYTINGSGSDNFSIKNNSLYIKGNTSVGTYILTVIATDEYSNSSVTATFTVNIKNTTTTRYITTERDYDYTTRRTTPTRTPRPTSPTRTPRPTSPTRTPRPTSPSTRPTTRKTTSNDCTCTGGPDCYNGVICKPGKKPWIMDCCQ